MLVGGGVDDTEEKKGGEGKERGGGRCFMYANTLYALVDELLLPVLRDHRRLRPPLRGKLCIARLCVF